MTTQTRSKSTIAFAVACTMFLSACMGSGGSKLSESDPNLTESERVAVARLNKQNKDYKNNMLKASGMGCLAAMMAARATGLVKGKLGWNDLAACGGGVLLATIVTDIVSKRKEKYQDQNAAYESLLTDSKENNVQIKKSISAANNLMALDRQKISSVKAALRKGEINQTEANKRLSTVDEHGKYLQQMVADLQEDERTWRNVASEVKADDPTRAKQISREADKIKMQIAALEQNVSELIEYRTVSSV